MTIAWTALRFLLTLAFLAIAPPAGSAAILSPDLAASMDNPQADRSSLIAVERFGLGDISGHREGNHSFQLSEVQSVSVGGSDYYVFLLDARDAAPGHVKDQSLDALRLYVADRGECRSAQAVAAEGTLAWEMPAGDGMTWPWGAGDASHRRGTDRREILIARSAFEGIDPSQFLYLYSRFSPTYDDTRNPRRRPDEDGGLSGWHALETAPIVAEPATQSNPPLVAEPPTLLMIATGLLAAASIGRRRQR